MWEDVAHFVILPNYKEDIDILREAIDTLAISTVARTQVRPKRRAELMVINAEQS
jgi:hypothetical protein